MKTEKEIIEKIRELRDKASEAYDEYNFEEVAKYDSMVNVLCWTLEDKREV